MGAVATGGARFLNDQIVGDLNIPEYVIDKVEADERQELARRERAYRGGRPPLQVSGRTAILVDDALATEATMRAEVRATPDAADMTVAEAVRAAAHPLPALPKIMTC